MGAIDQSRNPAIEIRLGGIYGLERIANESEKDYWPIVEILTAYVRKNSCIDSRLEEHSISMDTASTESTNKEYSKIKKFDIQAILDVIGRRKYYLNDGKSNRLNLQKTCLQRADLKYVHFERVILINANLEGAKLADAHFEESFLTNANLKEAILWGVPLQK